MPSAVRVGDPTIHGGLVAGPGVPTVLIGGMPAAVAGDTHVCGLPPIAHPATVTPFPAGSGVVLIGGRPALRDTDSSGCGAVAISGCPSVQLG